MRGNPRESQLSDAERVKGELAGLTQRPPNGGAPPSFSRGGDAPLGSQRKAGSLCPRVDGAGGGSAPKQLLSGQEGVRGHPGEGAGVSSSP